MLRSTSFMASFCVLAGAIMAHEGHGPAAHQEGITHYLVNPSHAIPIVLTIAAAVGIRVLVRRVRNAQR